MVDSAIVGSMALSGALKPRGKFEWRRSTIHFFNDLSIIGIVAPRSNVLNSLGLELLKFHLKKDRLSNFFNFWTSSFLEQPTLPQPCEKRLAFHSVNVLPLRLKTIQMMQRFGF
jgi:hypothetical protein